MYRIQEMIIYWIILNNKILTDFNSRFHQIVLKETIQKLKITFERCMKV